ncbi:hypothetical protein [Nocardiopsis dassonvillei]|uniref:hypothetical protein n=1 Tax=Nocardiopsis dassonvillei TaxID=2014 RepID=UPI003F575132
MFIDPSDVELDPLMQTWSRQIETELHRARDTGDRAPLHRLLAEITQSGPSTVTPGIVLALRLVQPAIDVATTPGSPDDPFLRLQGWAVDQWLCTRDELELAWLGKLLNIGLSSGWLPAPWYDALVVEGEVNPEVAVLLDQIERRTTQ